jgi:Zn-dependent protease with chaperone function
MCFLCDFKTSSTGSLEQTAMAVSAASAQNRWHPRRGFLLAAGAAAATPVLAQVDVGSASSMRTLVPAEQMEASAKQQYSQVLEQAKSKNALAPSDHPQLKRLHSIARRLIPFTSQWNPRVAEWRWEVNLIGSKQLNAWCMPGGKIAFYTGILEQLQLTDDEVAMIMGHEMAHALREHARERLAKSKVTSIGLSVASTLLGLGQIGDVAANLGTQLLTLKYSRDDETEADLVGLEIAARGGFWPEASVNLWKKMLASNGNGSPSFLSTHPSGSNRIQELQANLPKVQHLYEQAKQGG